MPGGISTEVAIVHVVDDDRELRESVRTILEISGYSVRVYPSAAAFLTSVQPSHGCVLMDLRMPDVDGLELQQSLRDRHMDLPVILMTGQGDVKTAVRAMKAGAIDYLEKPFETETLLGSVARALRESQRRLEAGSRSAEALIRLETLTPREREVLDFLVQGLSNKEIANELGSSPRTVEVHRARILDKLQAHGVADLVRLVMDAEGPDPGRL